MTDSLPQPTDEQIVSLIQQGDKEKFGLLMERYNKKLYRYGKKFLPDGDNIEDIIQDVFINTFQNINDFNTSLKFSSWIYRIAHNAFVNGLKKHQQNMLVKFDFDTLLSHHIYEDPAIEAEEYENMRKMITIGLDTLKPKYKEVIILHYLEELSYKEISDILQVPTGTVGIRVMRGKEILKKTYKEMNIDHGK